MDWIPVFTSKKYFHLIFDTIKFYQEHDELKIYAYVIMPNHIHLILSCNDVSKTMASIKKYSAKKIIEELKADKRTDILNKFYELKKDYKITSKYQVWQEGYHPQLISSAEMFEQKINYIHYNPVKKGLVNEIEEWKYSSAVDYFSDIKGLIDIEKL